MPWSPAIHARLPEEVTAQLQGGLLQGANLFQQKGCMNCHVVAGAGGLRGPELSDVGRRLSREQLTWRILSGAHNTICPELMRLLHAKGMTDVAVLVGGIIPEADIPALKEAGIAGIFLPGVSTQEIVEFVRSHARSTN